MDGLLEFLRSAEVELHQPGTRRDPSKLSALLHDVFLEFGRSGRTYDRAAIVDLLASEQPAGQVVAQDFEIIELGPDAALLTYRSVVIDERGNAQRHSVRSSVWVQTPDGWKLRFHQGTPTAEFEILAE
jgi:hypothetical protein